MSAIDVQPRASLGRSGVLLSGPGHVWMADVQIEVVGRDVPTTGMSTLHDHPVNLDFSE